MAEDSPSPTPEESVEDLGQQLVQRAAMPGVIRRDLAAKVRRSVCVADAGLAGEIQRRFTPESAPAWGQGPALPYTGGAAGFGAGSPMPGMSGMPGMPGGQTKPASPAPVARAVGAPAASPAAHALSGLGSTLQRRHLTAPSASMPAPVSVQRSAAAESFTPASPAAPAAAGPPIVRRSVASSPAPSAPDLPLRRMSEPEEEKPSVQRSAMSAILPVQAAPGRQELGPAIVRRSAGGPPSLPAPDLPLRRMSAPEEEEKPSVQRSAMSAILPEQASPARQELGPAIVRRSAGSPPSPPAPDLPLRRMSAPEEEEKPLVQRSAAPLVPASPPRQEAGPEIVHRSAVAPVSAPPAAPASAPAPAPVQAQVQRAASSPASLPLVQPVRGDGGASVVQAQRAAVSTLPASLTATAAGLTLPLARSAQPAGGGSGGAAGGGVVQRQAAAGDSGLASPAEPPGSVSAGAAAPAAVTGGAPAAGALDLDDVVEQVMRRLTRSLAVESERHGGRRWP